MITAIKNKNEIYGYIIKYKKKNGVNFLTPPELTQQVGQIKHKKNHIIKPHLHFKNFRKINYTAEVLIIQKGKVRLDLYSKNKKYLFSKILNKNNIVILIKGAHGFKILEPTEMLEIKQGPYSKKKDKELFENSITKIKLK